MDRKSSYKAKTTTSALNREKRQFLESKQRKDDRKKLIMSKRGLSNTLGREGEKKNDEDIRNKENNKPKLVKDTAGSMLRKKQLEEWLKGREEKKRLENKEKKKKPFYAGSRNITGSSVGVSITTHVCCHGTKVKTDTAATSKLVVVAEERNAKERTKNATQPSRRPVTRSQTTTKGKKDSELTRNTTVVKAKSTKPPPAATKTATVVKSKKSSRPGGTVTKKTATIDKAELPWISNSFINRDDQPPDFNSIFGETGTSPFQFGPTPMDQPQREFHFNFSMNNELGKTLKPYNPNKSLVTTVRGGAETTTTEHFHYVPAEDLMNSPVLSTPEKSCSTKKNDTVMQCVMRELASRTSSTQKALFQSEMRTPITAPSPKLVGRYSARSGLEVSRVATKPNKTDVSKKLVLEDSLEECSDVNRVKEWHDRHTAVVARLETLCASWEAKPRAVEERFESGNDEEEMTVSEEVMDTIRTTIGQTRLLIKERLNQFKNLCLTAEDPNAEKLVTLDDLHAFWDMVFMQVEDVEQKFEALAKLEGNDWKKTATVERPKPKRRRGKRAAVKSKKPTNTESTTTASSSSESNSNSKRDQMRQKLKELRAEGRRTRSQARAEAEVQILYPVDPRQPQVSSGVRQSPRTFKSPRPVLRSTRESERFNPADLGYDLAKYSKVQTHTLTTTPKGSNGTERDEDESTNVDLTFYTTVASTPPPPISTGDPQEDGNETLEFLRGSVPDSPVGDLICFTPISSVKKRRKSRSSPATFGSKRRGSVKMYSTITPSEKLLRLKKSKFEFDYVMSPVRRSARRSELKPKHFNKAGILEVEQLEDMPEGLRVVVVNNPNYKTDTP